MKSMTEQALVGALEFTKREFSGQQPEGDGSPFGSDSHAAQGGADHSALPLAESSAAV